jgi:type IV secretory pathway VirB2 component (pilin)
MKKALPIFLVLFLLALPLIANAQVNPEIVICNLLKNIEKIIAAIGFGLAVILLIAGGIGYMTAGGNPEKADKAKKLMINAIIGIVIVFAAIFILDLVAGLLSGSGISILTNNCPMAP